MCSLINLAVLEPVYRCAWVIIGLSATTIMHLSLHGRVVAIGTFEKVDAGAVPNIEAHVMFAPIDNSSASTTRSHQATAPIISNSRPRIHCATYICFVCTLTIINLKNAVRAVLHDSSCRGIGYDVNL